LASRSIHTSIDIDAPLDRVWHVLVAFDRYGDWNPLIPKMKTRAIVGADADFNIHLGGLRAKVQSTVARADDQRELTLCGPRSKLQHPLFHGEHFWRLEEHGDATRLVHGELFGGLLLPLLWWWIGPKLESGYAEMNEALKRRVEAEALPNVASPG
jgi:hypothetical protein